MATQPDATTADLRDWVAALRRVVHTDDPDGVDQLRLLEELKAAAAGAQARITLELDASQRAEQQVAGVPSRRLGTGVAAQVALARRESPVAGSRHLGLALALAEMPAAARALSCGQVSEWRVTLLARETACLTRADRARVDAELAARPGGLAGLGDRAVERESRRIAYRLDPHAFTRRSSKAVSERCVTLRPAPDTMSFLTGLLPVREGVAVYAALTRHADSLRSAGDSRGRGQIMADTLVERVTGQTVASAVPVEVRLVMTDAALMGDDAAAAQVEGYGPVPAPVARGWLADPRAAVWLRRLYTRPGEDTLVAMESTRRRFAGQLRAFIRIRDDVCRTPWCDAPARHTDHPPRHVDGGPTSAENAQALCEACNHAKEAAGWHARAIGAGGIETRTPTGHRYRSPVPPSPVAGAPPLRPGSVSMPEVSFTTFVLTA